MQPQARVQTSCQQADFLVFGYVSISVIPGLYSSAIIFYMSYLFYYFIFLILDIESSLTHANQVL